jgi:hypothetical protein
VQRQQGLRRRHKGSAACSIPCPRLSQRITPTGYLAVGLLADILARLLVRSYSLKEAILGSLQQHGNREDIGETRGLIDLMLTLYQTGVLPPQKTIALLDAGWTAEESLEQLTAAPVEVMKSHLEYFLRLD